MPLFFQVPAWLTGSCTYFSDILVYTGITGAWTAALVTTISIDSREIWPGEWLNTPLRALSQLYGSAREMRSWKAFNATILFMHTEGEGHVFVSVAEYQEYYNDPVREL